MRSATQVITLIHQPTAPTQDANGDDVYGDPVAQQVEVYGIAPSSSTEPGDPNRSSVVTGWDIYAPVGVVVGPHDHVRLPGVDDLCEIVGEPAVWDHNPHLSVLGSRGVVLKVRRVNG